MSKKRKIFGVGIVGAGLIGNKRAGALGSIKEACLVAVTDIDREHAQKLSDIYGGVVEGSTESLIRRDDVDVIIVAVPNKFILPIVVDALRKGKHVFTEKPFGRNSRESLAMLRASRRSGKLIKAGFNHRFHGSVLLAKKLFDEGKIGKALFIRARYGHGGRLGMEKEWRFQKDISGGGELLDQGVHIIDLARWFAGDPKTIYGLARTKFWKTKLDDNAFALMENDKTTVLFHVSTTNWKNIFSFEIFGDKGFLSIEGKGGSYGMEKLVWGVRPPRFGVPRIKEFAFDGDTSWRAELQNFFDALSGKAKIIGDGVDGLKANQIVEAIYKSSKSGKVVRLGS